MIHDVLLRPEAEQDLSDAAGWYEKQRPGLGHEFLDEVLEVFSVIADAPHIYPSVHRNTRRALIHRLVSITGLKKRLSWLLLSSMVAEIHAGGKAAHSKPLE